MKTTLSEMKNTLYGINGRLDITQENVTEFEGIAIESLSKIKQ